MNEKNDKNEEDLSKLTGIERRLANLRPIPKGVSGNPYGRPKNAVSITAAIKKKLQEVDPESKKTYLEIIIEKIIKEVAKRQRPNEKILKQLWEQIDGLPKQRVDLKEKIETLLMDE